MSRNRNKDRAAWGDYLREKQGQQEAQKQYKYGNEPTVFNGKKYPSQLEAAVAANLQLRKSAGLITHIEEQVSVKFYGRGVLLNTNRVDFRVRTAEGEVWYVEAKGKETDVFKIQKQLHIAFLDQIHKGAKYWIVRGTAKKLRWYEIEINRSASNGITGGFVKSMTDEF